jgi:CTP:molybdopterin cytidylyltransferase MocA
VVVLNDEWAEGMGSSVRTGVNALDNSVDGCIIVTCDMPAVAPSHLRELMHQGEITASRYAGRRGVPAYFPATAFDALTQLHGDAGARELLKNANAVQLPNGELDIDTAEDLLRAREIFG